MKKIIILASVAFLLLFQACKKTDGANSSTQPADSTLIKSINQWIDNFSATDSIAGSKGTIDSNKNNINWNSVNQISVSNNTNLIVADLKNNDNKVEKVLFIQDQNKKIFLGSLLTFTPDANAGPQDINKSIANIYEGNDVSYTGKLTALTFDEKFLQENTYTDGKLYSISVLKQKDAGGNKSATAQKVDIATCVNWYLDTYVNGVLVSEDYVFTSCIGAPCQSTRQTKISHVTFKIDCNGGGGSGGSSTTGLPDLLCPSTFANFQAITSDNSSYALNISGLKFVAGDIINSFDLYINVQNYVSWVPINNSQPTAVTGFLPPAYVGYSPIEMFETVPQFAGLLQNGDIKYTFNPINNSTGYSFTPYAYSVIAAVAADWAAQNTTLMTTSPATDVLAAGLFITQFNGILQALIPGSRVRASTVSGVKTNLAVYDPTGLCR